MEPRLVTQRIRSYQRSLVFDTKTQNRYTLILGEWKRVLYRGDAVRLDDIGAVRCVQALHDIPKLCSWPDPSSCKEGRAPPHRPSYVTPVTYFEMQIVELGNKGKISIGLAKDPFSPSHHIGWDPETVGFFGSDGTKLCGSHDGIAFGPPFCEGDIIGCGVVFEKGEVFFTRNGECIGVATTCFDASFQYYPSVSLHCKMQEVEIPETLVFDIESYIERIYSERIDEIRSIPLRFSLRERDTTDHAGKKNPAVDRQVMCKLVQNYMLSMGYIQSFEKMSSVSLHSANERVTNQNSILECSSQGMDVDHSSPESCYSDLLPFMFEPADKALESSLVSRNVVMKLILSGEIQQARKAVDERFARACNFPMFGLDPPMSVSQFFSFLEFIWLVRRGQCIEAILFAQHVLQDIATHPMMIRAAGLLAYPNPHDSPSCFFLHPRFMHQCSLAVNSSLRIFLLKKRRNPVLDSIVDEFYWFPPALNSSDDYQSPLSSRPDLASTGSVNFSACRLSLGIWSSEFDEDPFCPRLSSPAISSRDVHNMLKSESCLELLMRHTFRICLSASDQNAIRTKYVPFPFDLISISNESLSSSEPSDPASSKSISDT